jgi:hypothetical protein
MTTRQHRPSPTHHLTDDDNSVPMLHPLPDDEDMPTPSIHPSLALSLMTVLTRQQQRHDESSAAS